MKATMTVEGQITIPQEIQAQLGIAPGDEVELLCDGNEVRQRKPDADEPFTRYRGFLKNLAGRDTDEIIAEMRGR